MFALLLAPFFLPARTHRASVDSVNTEIKGIPGVIHYRKNDYHSDSQFWTMAESKSGILYFGNNDGIVIYDGEKWDLMKLPNGSTVRSLACASDGMVYVGGYNEIGYITRDNNGLYHYESINNLLRPEDRNFDDIWQINETQGYIIFRSFKMLIAVARNKAVTLPANNRFSYQTVIDDRFYVVDSWGLKQLNLSTLEFDNLVERTKYNHEEISCILPGREKKELILFTKPGYSYLVYPDSRKILFHLNHFLPNSSDQIFCAIKSKNGLYYQGTINSQVIAFQLTEKPSIENRTFKNLQDNTVLNLYETEDGNIWALLNKGIDCIETASPVSMIFDNAAIYDVVIHNNIFYLATNQGVYSAELQSGNQYLFRENFEIIDGLEAQAWSLWVYENKVVVGHDRGVYVIDENGLYKVDGTNGIWKVIPIKGHKNQYLACAYDGLYLLEYNLHRKFVLKNRVERFDISGRDIMQSNDPGIFWICHGYKGIYRIKINENFTRTLTLEHYTIQNGLPSQYNTNIFKWKEDTVFATTNGVYEFVPKSNQFMPHKDLNAILGEKQIIRKLIQQGNKTWFIQDDELGYFNTDSENPTLHKDLFLSLKGSFIKGMEFLLPLNDLKILVGTNNGLYLFDLSYQVNTEPVQMLITQVKYKSPTDSLVYCSLDSEQNDPLKIPNNSSYLSISYATPKFNDQTDIQYSYKLENIDNNWSSWSASAEKEFSYLKSGNYIFRVRSRSLLGEKSREATYYFRILPKWYQTQWAILLFSVLVITSAILAAAFVKRKLKKTRQEEQKRRNVLELELQQMRLEREKERIKRDKEKLEEDVIFKSKELANYTMLLVKKRELLTDIREDLKGLKEVARNEQSRNMLRNLVRKIGFHLDDEEHIQVFEANFERVHHEFFQELKTHFPDLNSKELRLCALVKMNLSNKEIAPILNISLRGVETARYRLRKRLSLHHEENMVEFLEKLAP